jgi:addiction module HigA family antidote
MGCPARGATMNTDLIELSTPGEVLKEEFLDPMGITPYALAKGIFVDPPRIDAIIKGRRRITADTAARLSRFFGTTPGFWMNMQSRYDIEKLVEEKSDELERIRLHEVSS